MPDAVERLVNLAFFLASARAPVTVSEIRAQVGGYPEGQEEDAFLRMFERDKRELRTSGFAVATVDLPSGQAYELDGAATFQLPIALSTQDAATLRAVGAALVADHGFPFRHALATALAKLSASPGVPRPGRLVVEEASNQGEVASRLAAAAIARKRVGFDYAATSGTVSLRTVEPFGLFLRDGRWYLVGRDTGLDEVRVFAVRRVRNLTRNDSRPGTPDYAVPNGLDPRSFARLPFQYGETEFEAVLEFAQDVAWRAPFLTEGQGRLESGPSGTVLWTVDAADVRRLARWAIENYPGVRLLSPPSAVLAMREGLVRVAGDHGFR